MAERGGYSPRIVNQFQQSMQKTRDLTRTGRMTLASRTRGTASTSESPGWKLFADIVVAATGYE